MRFTDLDQTDRRIAQATMGIATLLAVGLIVTGVLLFFAHTPNWDSSQVFQDARPLPVEPLGLAGAHAALGDIAAAFALLVTAWWSYRVIASVSGLGIACMVVIATGIISGGLIRYNALVVDGELVPDVVGFGRILGGDYDYLVVGRYDFRPVTAIAWTVAHLLSTPILFILLWRGRVVSRRNGAKNDSGVSWLDQLPHKPNR